MPKTAKKPTRSKLIKKLDVVFSQYIRLSNADNRGMCTCVTCNKQFHWKNIQAGHFMSRKHYSTRWNENNVKPQCVGCNMFKSGEQYKYSIYNNGMYTPQPTLSSTLESNVLNELPSYEVEIEILNNISSISSETRKTLDEIIYRKNNEVHYNNDIWMIDGNFEIAENAKKSTFK